MKEPTMTINGTDKYRIGHHYKDFAGSGVFFLNADDTSISWGYGPNNVIIEGKEAAKEFAKGKNRPNTTDDWQPFPIGN
jgi:hypothetical protein